MNLLNEQLRSIRIQLCMEENRENPDVERINQLKKEEKECLKKLLQ